MSCNNAIPDVYYNLMSFQNLYFWVSARWKYSWNVEKHLQAQVTDSKGIFMDNMCAYMHPTVMEKWHLQIPSDMVKCTFPKQTNRSSSICFIPQYLNYSCGWPQELNNLCFLAILRTWVRSSPLSSCSSFMNVFLFFLLKDDQGTEKRNAKRRRRRKKRFPSLNGNSAYPSGQK